VQVRTKNKQHKEFNHLFLAQKLPLAVQSESPAESELPGESLTSLSTTDHNSHRKKNPVWAMKFSNNGRYLAAGGQDGIVRVWAVLSDPEERGREAFASSDSAPTSTTSAANQDPPSTPKKERQSVRAPVLSSKPLHELRGHTADVLDLSWSKVSQGA
jgi:WD40 repeat protein